MSNYHERKARTKKAFDLYLVLRETDLSDADLEGADASLREHLRCKANIHPPSDKTWALACAMVRNHRSSAGEDPFEGL